MSGPGGALSAGDPLPRRSSQELRELSRRTDPDWAAAARGYKEQRDVLQFELDAARVPLAQRARVAAPDVHEAVGVLNALVAEHGGKEECEALAVLLNALRAAGRGSP